MASQPLPFAARTWTDAPASLTVKFMHHGYDVSLTLRGETGGDVLTKLDTALEWLEEHGATTTHLQPAAAPAQAAQPAAPADPSYCTIHNCTMGKRTANGDTWYSHKVDGAYCRGAK